MSHKFDELTKSMAQSVTRRSALKKLSVGLAGMALACFGLVPKAKAAKGGRCKETGENCKKNTDCCSGWCQLPWGKYQGNKPGTCL